jgi:hypothetical protein
MSPICTKKRRIGKHQVFRGYLVPYNKYKGSKKCLFAHTYAALRQRKIIPTSAAKISHYAVKHGKRRGAC